MTGGEHENRTRRGLPARHASAPAGSPLHETERSSSVAFVTPSVGWGEGVAVRAKESKVLWRTIVGVAVNVVDFEWNRFFEPRRQPTPFAGVAAFSNETLLAVGRRTVVRRMKSLQPFEPLRIVLALSGAELERRLRSRCLVDGPLELLSTLRARDALPFSILLSGAFLRAVVPLLELILRDPEDLLAAGALL